jgi:hypothetical protein
MHAIRREARREAWYGDSMNPFRKVARSRSATNLKAGFRGGHDVEMSGGDDGPLSNIQTDPYPISNRTFEMTPEKALSTEVLEDKACDLDVEALEERPEEVIEEDEWLDGHVQIELLWDPFGSSENGSPRGHLNATNTEV